MKAGKVALWGFILTIALLLGSFYVGADEESDPRSQLTFNHRLHLVEVGAACDDCHQPAATSHSADDNLYPAMKLCGECHNVEDKAECATCHAQPDRIIPLPGQHPDYQVFDHSRHTGAGFACQDCHSRIAESRQWSSNQQLLPPMSACLDCHRQQGQTLDCAACHYGRHPQPGDLNFTEWTRTHGLEAAFDPEYFEQYYELGYCEDCHQGLNMRGEVHQPGWLFVHGDEAAAGGECLVCHEDRTECSSCHRTMLPVPHTLGDPGWDNPVSGGRHKSEAEAFFEACLSCHDMGSASPTCTRCH